MTNRELILRELINAQEKIFRMGDNFSKAEFKDEIAGDYIINITIEKNK